MNYLQVVQDFRRTPIAATIKALGYPSRSLLSGWLQELHPQARTRVVGRSQELAPAAKQSAVIALCMRRASAQAVAEDLGVSRDIRIATRWLILAHAWRPNKSFVEVGMPFYIAPIAG